jgi:hypothetical protein
VFDHGAVGVVIDEAFPQAMTDAWAQRLYLNDDERQAFEQWFNDRQKGSST